MLRQFTAVLMLSVGASGAQTPAAAPSFEVATIKPAQPFNPAMMASGKVHLGMKTDAGRVDIGFMSLSDLVCAAYEVKSYQVAGPDWITTERYDIVAKLPDGATKEQIPAMLKALLAERFKLEVHHDTRPHNMYALIVGKGGPKLKDAAPEQAAAEDGVPAGKGGMVIDAGQGAMRVNPSSDGKGAVVSDSKGGTMKMSMGPDGTMHMEASRTDMRTLAEMLTRFVDRPVTDETGLKGKYQIALDLSMADLMRVARASGMMPGGMGGPMPGGAGGASAADAASDPGSGGSIFTNVQQLGLKLDPRKEPVDTIVVDHAEKMPSEN